jgi:hypothetical protein
MDQREQAVSFLQDEFPCRTPSERVISKPPDMGSPARTIAATDRIAAIERVPCPLPTIRMNVPTVAGRIGADSNGA